MIAVANKIALGQIDAGSPAAWTRRRTRRSPSTRTCARSCSTSTARSRCPRGRGRLTRLRPGQVVPSVPQNAEPRTGLSMGEHAALMARDWGVTRAEQDELAVASHVNMAAAYERGFYDGAGVAVPRARARPEPARRHVAREAGEAQAGLRRPGHHDRGNSTPLPTGVGRAAGVRGVGGGARVAGAGLLRRRADRGRRSRPQGRGAADGARLRDAGAARSQRVGLQDFDLYEIHEAFASQVWRR